MLRYSAPLCAAALLLAGCAGQRSAVATLGAQTPQPVELHVYMHGADGSVTTSTQPAPLSQVPQLAATHFEPQSLSYQPTLSEPQPVNPYAPALIVDTDGQTRPTIGAFKGSEPSERVSFTAEEADHIKIVWIAPRQGEMLIVPLSPLKEQFRYPLRAGQLLSPYGWRGNAMHTGSDLKAYPGDTVFAVLDGVVRMSKPYSGYGNIVLLRHANGLETLYGHNAQNLVAVNQQVRAGDPIALAGRTGRASTEHVHFEVRVAGRALDPALMVDIPARTLRNDTLYIYNQGDLVMALKSNTAPDYFNQLKAGIPAPIAAAGRAYMTMGRGHVYADPQRSYLPSQTTTATPPQAKPEAWVEFNTPATPSYESLQVAERLNYAPASDSEYHVLRPKETLFALTRLYGISIHELLAINPQITDPNHVLIGERVRIRR